MNIKKSVAGFLVFAFVFLSGCSAANPRLRLRNYVCVISNGCK